MTISTTIVKNSYNGDSTTATFNFTFKVLAESEIKVIIRSANATETIKTLNTHYSITGIGNANGGSITFTAGNIPSSTEQVVLIRETAKTQNIDYLSNDPFPAETHEEGLDRGIMISQELVEEIGRSIKLSKTNTMNSTEFSIGAADRAGKILGFDNNGELVVSQELGSYAGVWGAATTYSARDIVKDSSNNNIYLCNTGHTASGTTPISSNADVAKWDLLVDAYSSTASAAAASASASAALVSENNSATSESNSATSETNAAASATNASNSASAASTSETNAAASYDSFDDRYLGAKGTVPSVDNDGDALIDGALYFDTTDNVLKVYDLGTTSWKRTTPTSTQQTAIDNVDGISADVTTVAGISANVTTVAGISADVTTVAANDADITTVATNIASVNTVATDIAKVIAVADDLAEAVSEVETVANDLNEATSEIEVVANSIANVDAVGTNIANVNTVATNDANITTVAGINADVTTVANDGTDIGTVAGSIANVNTVAGNNANITTVAGISANVTAVAGDATDIGTVATNLTGTNTIGTVAGSIANVNTVAGSIANVNEVANNIGTVNNFGDRYRVQAGEPSVNNDEGDLVYDTTANAVKVYNGTSFDTIQQGITDVAPTRHSIRPSLNLDFANSKVLDPRITFTRASNATYYDGYTSVKAEENLATQSQSFTGWTNFNSTDTQNTVAAPDGTTTATTLNEGSTTNYHAFYLEVTGLVSTGITYTLSFFAKENTGRYVNLAINSTTAGTGQYAAASYDLQLGTVSDTGQAGSGYAVTNTSITSVGNGWYRCVLTGTFGSSIFAPRIYIANGNTGVVAGYGLESYAGTNRDVYIWGAQLEKRDTVTAYTPTTTLPITKYQPVLQTAGNNVARFDHNPTTGESLGLLIEEQRTNVAINSEGFSNATWGKTRCTIDANKAIAPDGTQTADLIVGNGVSGSKVVLDAAIATPTANSLWTTSVYAKTIGSVSNFRVELGFGANNGFGQFNLSTGTVTSFNYSGTVSNATASITDVGNGWYRCSVTVTFSASWSGNTNIALYDFDSSTTTFGSILIWGAQIEAGAFPTSYIPTVASQVTRSADDAEILNIDTSEWFNNQEGTLYTNLNINTLGNTNVGGFSLGDNNNLAGNRIEIRAVGSSTTVPRFDMTTNGVGQMSIGSPNLGTETNRRLSLSYSMNDYNVSTTANGNSVTADTSGNIPILNKLVIGKTVFNNLNQLNGTIKKASYYPKALTNNEIIDLTEE